MGLFSGSNPVEKKKKKLKKDVNPYGYVETQGAKVSSDALDEMPDMEAYQVNEIISKARQVATTREGLFKTYEKMEQDGTVQSALNLICEDCTQVNTDTMKQINIVAPHKTLEQEVRMFFDDVVGCEEKIYPLVYQFLVYGEAFVETFYTRVMASPVREGTNVTFKKWKLVEDPGDICAIERDGSLIGYLDKRDPNNIKIASPNDFIHFIAYRSYRTEKIELDVCKNVPMVDPNTKESYTREEWTKEVFNCRVGVSYLKTAVKDYQTLDLIEQMVLISRLTKSNSFRFWQIDVKNASQIETERLIGDLKRTISKKEGLSLSNEAYSSENLSRAINSDVIVPTRNGKGAATVQNIGGDVDVKALVDLDYFRNNFQGDLRIPAAYLGYNSDGQQILGDTSLTKQDARYARLCKSTQAIIDMGLDAMKNLYFKMVGRSEKAKNVKVFLTRVLTAEDTDLQNDIKSRAELITPIMEALDKLDPEGQYVDKKKLIDYILVDILKLSNTSKFIKGEEKPAVTKTDNPEEIEVDDAAIAEAEVEMTEEETDALSDMEGESSGQDLTVSQDLKTQETVDYTLMKVRESKKEVKNDKN